MKARWRGRARLPQDVEQQAGLDRGERVLAYAVDDHTGAHVVATTTHLTVANAERQVLRRPWHEVDAGVWSSEHWTLSVSWVARARPAQWTFRDQETRLPEAVHERVQASVVLSAELPLSDPRQRGRVVIRKDLATSQMMVQTVLGRSTPASDPQVQEAVASLTADLRERVGL